MESDGGKGSMSTNPRFRIHAFSGTTSSQGDVIAWKERLINHSLRRRWPSLASPMTTIQYVPVPKLSPPFLSCHRPAHSFLYLSALTSLPIGLLPAPHSMPAIALAAWVSHFHYSNDDYFFPYTQRRIIGFYLQAVPISLPCVAAKEHYEDSETQSSQTGSS